MQAHVAYWSGLIAKRTAIAFGPVADPKGAWGLGVVEVENEDEVRGIVDDDPVMKAGAGFSCDVYPMPAGDFEKLSSRLEHRPGSTFRTNRRGNGVAEAGHGDSAGGRFACAAQRFPREGARKGICLEK